MRCSILTVLVALAAPSAGLADGRECGTVVTDHDREVMRRDMAAGLYDNKPVPRSIVYVPLTFHVVRTSAGTDGLPMDRICQAVSDANGAFLGAEIQFYLLGPIDYIDSDAFYYDIDTYGEIDALRTTNRVPDTVNIYFTANLASENGSLCGISAFTSSSVQAIAMNNSCTAISGNHSTFPHELGHYFNLYHTHETAFGVECVDASNCGWAGDLMCDTSADPGLGTDNVDAGCSYVGTETDSCNNDPYGPDPTNLMSYSRKPCRDFFSDEQQTRAYWTLVGSRPVLVHEALPGLDQCLVIDGCVHEPGHCDDGNVCTIDICVEGACSNTPGGCDDGFGCTVDACVDEACTYEPDAAACDDGIYCDGVERCWVGYGCAPGPAPCEEDQQCREATQTCEPPAVMSCTLSDLVAPPEGSTALELYLEHAYALRGYSATIQITRTSGTGSLVVREPCTEGIHRDAGRIDYAFHGLTHYFVGDCVGVRMACVLADAADSLDIGSDPRRYLGTFELGVSPDAVAGSTFEIDIVMDPNSSLLQDADSRIIPFTVPCPCTLTVGCCEPHVFGDLPDADGGFGCQAGLQPNLGDIVCTLNGFAASAACPTADLVSVGADPCVPDGVIDLADIVAMLESFAGHAPCSDEFPCPGGCVYP